MNIKKFAVFVDKNINIHTAELGKNIGQADILASQYVNKLANLVFPISIIWARTHEEAKKHYMDWDIDRAYRR